MNDASYDVIISYSCHASFISEKKMFVKMTPHTWEETQNYV